MAINKNHEFEELNGVKCAIVEKNVSETRITFLQELLQFNNYTVVVSGTTIGVTDVTFNPINAIFGRLLKAPNGRVVTLAYWQQNESSSNDDVPYFMRK
jgi:hypothetical protein